MKAPTRLIIGSLLVSAQAVSCSLFIGFEDKSFLDGGEMGGEDARGTGAGMSAEAGASTGGTRASGGASSGGKDMGGDEATGGVADVGSGGTTEGTGGSPQPPAYGKDLISCQGLVVSCNADVAGCCAADKVFGGTTSQGRIANGKDYSPERAVTVSDFFLSRFEVNVGRFRKFEQAYADWRSAGHPLEGEGAHPKVSGSGWQAAWSMELPPELPSTVHSCSPEWAMRSKGSDEHPMNCASWYDAFAFCAWDGGRLPTEAEWEFAAAGGDLRRNFPWGTSSPIQGIDAVWGCGYAVDCIDKVVEVGSLARGVGRFGQYEMAGNLGEWVMDAYESNSYLNTPNCVDCVQLAPESPSDSARVWRGGVAYNPDPIYLYTFHRFNSEATTRALGVGFRCAYDALDAE